MIYDAARRGQDRGIQTAMNETAHPKPGARIMTTLAHATHIGGRNAKRMTIGSVCKVAAAVVGTISVLSIVQLSHAQSVAAAATDLANQTELRDLLCRIDHRCPSGGEASRMQAVETTTR